MDGGKGDGRGRMNAVTGNHCETDDAVARRAHALNISRRARIGVGAGVVAVVMAACGGAQNVSTTSPTQQRATSTAAGATASSSQPSSPVTDNPSTSAPAATPGTATTSALLATARQLWTNSAGADGPCEDDPNDSNGTTGEFGRCPVTTRLMQRMTDVYFGRCGAGICQGNVEPICRCQSFDPGVTITQVASGAELVIGSAGSHPVRLDLLFVTSAGRVVVDDLRCHGGGVDASIFVGNPPPC